MLGLQLLEERSIYLSNMLISWILLSATVGVFFNLSFAGMMVQPDWSLAILVGTLLHNRHAWFWILPYVMFHDLVLYWSLWVTFPYVLVTVMLIFYVDHRLAPGQPQRWFGLVLCCTALLFVGVDIWTWLLTLTLSIAVWSRLPSERERAYVEPA